MDSRPHIVVFAYSEMGARCLERLLAHGARVVALYTHRDDPNESLWFQSVAQVAQDHGIPILWDAALDASAEFERLGRLSPDLIFSFYFRRLIPMRLLGLAKLGAFNMHGSLLPRYRGRAPVNWAIARGETETGATLHHMVAKPDAGDIVDQERVPIDFEDTAAIVGERVVEAACRILDRRFEALMTGTAPRRPQDESQASYFGRRTPEDGAFSWEWNAREIADLVRAVAPPYPGAFCAYGDARRLYVWRARAVAGASEPGQMLSSAPRVVACGHGALELLEWEWRASPVHAGL